MFYITDKTQRIVVIKVAVSIRVFIPIVGRAVSSRLVLPVSFQHVIQLCKLIPHCLFLVFLLVVVEHDFHIFEESISVKSGLHC